MEKLLLGIDVGTTSIKASLYSYEHKLITSACRNYTLLTPKTNYVEFPVDEYWQTVCDMTNELMKQVNGSEVCALALSCQGETLICLDQDGKPLRQAIVWLDNRAEAEAAELKKVFSLRQVYEISGQADMLATWPAAKILWLKRHESDTFTKTNRFMLLADYLVYRMTGEYIGEENLWASSAMLNIHSGAWWQDMLEYLTLSPDRLPQIQHCATPVGELLPEAADALGLNANCIVVTGALDQTCNMIGCGMTEPGNIMETTGSCLAVGAILDHFIPYDPMHPVTCQNTAVPGQYTVLLWSQSAGMTLKWFAQKFYGEYADPEEAYPQINDEAAAVTPGCKGLVMLPHLTGAANPEYDSHAAGVFAGIRLEHGRGYFARAVMESVACMLKRNLDQLVPFGIDGKNVYCAGGGAASPLWLQIKADMTGRNMIPMTARDSACHGAAVLAGVGAGIFKDVHWQKTSGSDICLKPDPQQKSVYEKVFSHYVALYDALKPYFEMTDKESL